MIKPNITVEWQRPISKSKSNFPSFSLETLEISELITSTGLEKLEPMVIGANTTKEELVALLQLAAEVEHVLMVQYLYTMLTVKNTVDDPDNDKYVKALKLIAIQEMGHFISVQNLLIALDGITAVHLHKDILRPNNQQKPLPFSLEPLSKDAIAKYTVIEMPVSVVADPSNSLLVKHVADLIGMTPNPVGIIYDKILELLEDNSITYLVNEDNQSEKDFWGANPMTVNDVILEIVGGKKEAKKLTELIAEQGEGPANDSTKISHFSIFHELFENFKPNDEIQKKIAINPALKDNKEFKFVTIIENEYSKLWILLFNYVYCSLLLDIYGSLLTKPKSPTKFAKKFSSLAHQNMMTSHLNIANIIFDLPVSTSTENNLDLASGNYCGPTYEIPSDIIFENEIDKYIEEVTRISQEITKYIDNIQNHIYFDSHNDQRPNVSQTLNTISDDIKNRYKLLNKLKNEEA